MSYHVEEFCQADNALLMKLDMSFHVEEFCQTDNALFM